MCQERPRARNTGCSQPQHMNELRDSGRVYTASLTIPNMPLHLRRCRPGQITESVECQGLLADMAEFRKDPHPIVIPSVDTFVTGSGRGDLSVGFASKARDSYPAQAASTCSKPTRRGTNTSGCQETCRNSNTPRTWLVSAASVTIRRPRLLPSTHSRLHAAGQTDRA